MKLILNSIFQITWGQRQTRCSFGNSLDFGAANRPALFPILLVTLLFCFWVQAPFNQANGQEVTQPVRDDLAQKRTWKPKDLPAINSAFEDWTRQSDLHDSTQQLTAFLEKDFPQQKGQETIDAVINGIVLARPDVNQVRERLRKQRTNTTAPDFSSLLDNPEEQDFLRDHVRLYYARWLTQNEFYDEAMEQFALIKLESVLDPSTLLFYRGLVEHQLLKKDACLATINQLLENSDQLPRRYTVISKLMLADIEPMEPDSLDEIARMMSDIRRRTDLFRSGKIVIDKEKKVIDKLDKLIEELEAQQQAMQQSNSTESNTPMQDSRIAGGKAAGDATSKRQKDGGDWGDLPPADRAAALAEMAKDMPPHYRAVIEEYFRQLAKEDER